MYIIITGIVLCNVWIVALTVCDILACHSYFTSLCMCACACACVCVNKYWYSRKEINEMLVWTWIFTSRYGNSNMSCCCVWCAFILCYRVRLLVYYLFSFFFYCALQDGLFGIHVLGQETLILKSLSCWIKLIIFGQITVSVEC